MAVAVAAGVATLLAFGASWLWLRRRCFPEFKARLDARGIALVVGLPLLAWRAGSWLVAFGVLSVVVVSAWISSRGRIERFFPRRWFYATGTGPAWLSGFEIVAFFALLAVGCVAVYHWAN